jgi:hypothetical protein
MSDWSSTTSASIWLTRPARSPEPWRPSDSRRDGCSRPPEAASRPGTEKKRRARVGRS